MITISKEDLERIIPVTASSHVGVYESIMPILDDTSAYVCENVLGEAAMVALDAEPDGELLQLAKRYIAHLAVLSVLRQLDVVLTPTGFGVVSNDNVSPASKQRVDALESSLRTAKEKARWKLLRYLCQVEGWGEQPIAYGLIDNLYDGHCFFFDGGHPQRTYLDWEAAQQAITEADDYLRVHISDELMNDMLAAYRTYSDRFRSYLPAIRLVRRVTGLWIGSSPEHAAIPFRRLIRTIESDEDIYALYFNSTAYEVNHHEVFQNTKDSTAFVFGG